MHRTLQQPFMNASSLSLRGMVGHMTTGTIGATNGMHMQVTHESVLAAEVVAALDVKDGQTIVDATVGQGGHSEALLSARSISLLGLDADPTTTHFARERLKPFGNRVRIISANFRDMQAVLKEARVTTVDRVLFDLGWNRGQLAAGKGFSFQTDEPLNMSYGQKPVSGFTAADIVNTWSEEAIGNVLFGYGGERYARRIAKTVAEARRISPITTTGELTALIAASVPASYRHGRVHFATKSFQALRIAVNDELGSLKKGLSAAWDLIASGGRIAVITFHSLEDALVKKQFAAYVREGGVLLTKKPITPSRAEVMHNRAARSAKLRVLIKE